jgi:hypothetical protein
MATSGNMKPMRRDSNGKETLKPARGVARKGTTSTVKPMKKYPLDSIANAKKPNKMEKIIQDVTNRYRVTAREARDIVTAAGTAFQADQGAAIKAHGGQGVASGPAGKNFVKQVKETAIAAATGKKGTTSDYVPQYKNQVVGMYRKGTKRK